MSLHVVCPHCGNGNLVAPPMAGQLVPCKSCGMGMALTTSMPTAPPPKPNSSGAGTAVAVTAGVSGAIIFLIAGIIIVFIMICAGLGFAILYPAVKVAGEAAERTQCQNNMKQMAIAMLNFNDVHQHLPSAYTVDDDGNRLHSWRTELLPYTDNQYAYEGIDHDLAWDHQANRHIRDLFVGIYQCPSAEQKPGMTNYMVVVGPDTLFPGSEPIKLEEVIDGVSNTVMVVEVPGPPIPWGEPRDITIDELIDRLSQDTIHPGTIAIVMADGSVQNIPTNIDPETLRGMCTRNGGEVIHSFF